MTILDRVNLVQSTIAPPINQQKLEGILPLNPIKTKPPVQSYFFISMGATTKG